MHGPFSLDRIISVSDPPSPGGYGAAGEGKVVYRAEKADCQPFPILGDERLFRGISRNFEVFDPLEFLAACRAVASERRRKITQHIPDPAYIPISSKTDAFGHDGTQIGTQNFRASRRGQAQPVTETFPHDLIEVAHAWPTLSDELKAAVLAIIRTGASRKGLESA